MPVTNKQLSQEWGKMNAKIAFLQGCVRGLSDRLHMAEISGITLAKGLDRLSKELEELKKFGKEKS